MVVCVCACVSESVMVCVCMCGARRVGPPRTDDIGQVLAGVNLPPDRRKVLAKVARRPGASALAAGAHARLCGAHVHHLAGLEQQQIIKQAKDVGPRLVDRAHDHTASIGQPPQQCHQFERVVRVLPITHTRSLSLCTDFLTRVVEGSMYQARRRLVQEENA
jgi:hypothetical protein